MGCSQDFVLAQLSDGSEASTGTSGPNLPPTDSTTTAQGSQDGSGSSRGGEPVATSADPQARCEAPARETSCDGADRVSVFEAIGLNCGNDPADTIALTEMRFQSADEDAWRVTTDFGAQREFLPREGATMLVLSTGTLPFSMTQSSLALPEEGGLGTDNDNPDNQALPGAIRTQPGSSVPYVDCDGENDCSHSVEAAWGNGLANDLIWFTFSAEVPPGTSGWAVDLAWFSNEFPQHVENQTDLLVWWQQSQGFTGNVATLGGQALTTRSLVDTIHESQLFGEAPQLEGTSFGGAESGGCDYPPYSYPNCPYGGATGWMTLRGPAVPGDVLTTTVALADLGGLTIDTVVLMDNWRWECEGCTLGDTCGLSP